MHRTLCKTVELSATLALCHFHEKLYRKTKYVKELHSKDTALDKELEKAQGDRNVMAQEKKELYSQNEASSRRTSLPWRECLVRRLLSSDEFHAALAHVVSLGISFGVEKGLRMGCTDVEFEAAAQNVYNFLIGAKAEFNKAFDAFPSI
nr:hypothetical protein [Tanacetum cinerariifolium]